MENEKSKEKDFKFANLGEFKEALNKAPASGWILERKLGGGKKSKYIPLFAQEAISDYLFRHCDIMDEKYMVVHNELICTIKLSFLPDFPDAEHRFATGSGAKPIQCDSGSIPSRFPNGKKTNALEYNTGAARAAAKSSALTSLGNVFGRNLNRDVRNDYQIKK